MRHFNRITWNPNQMNGQPCIRGMRLTVRRVVEAVALYPDRDDLCRDYPELEPDDIRQALAFAAANLEDSAVRKATANERFVRWQGRTRDQFGQATNLVLALAVGTLGFSINLVMRPEFTISGPVKLAFDSSLVFSVLSIFGGIGVMCLRLVDARLTTKIAGFAEKGVFKTRLTEPRRKVRQLGECSWFWFYFQLLTFGAGTWFLVLRFVWKYHSRLL